jgi:CRP-like cAMP-binding protein
MLAWGRQLVEPICSRQREQGVMKIVMNMVRKPFKKGEVIFETNEKSDELFLINSGKVEIRSREGFLLATLGEGELFGEMASIMGERERTARAVSASTSVIDVIDASTMQRKLGEADPVLRALIRNLTNRLANANQKNEDQWQQLNIYRSLVPDEIQRP